MRTITEITVDEADHRDLATIGKGRDRYHVTLWADSAPKLLIEVRCDDPGALETMAITWARMHWWKDHRAIGVEKIEKVVRPECAEVSPHTRQKCTMGRGHAGSHRAGGPYHTVEAWTTQCADGKCEYHPNRSNLPLVMRWQECIHCGHKKPLSLDKYLLQMPGGAVELFASSEAEARSLVQAFIERQHLPTPAMKLLRYAENPTNLPAAVLIEVPLA